MDRRRIIDLKLLAENHSAEIAKMSAAIKGGADCTLWTSELRASVRGGKPIDIRRPEQSHDSDNQS
jgi:hypothetical protein